MRFEEMLLQCGRQKETSANLKFAQSCDYIRSELESLECKRAWDEFLETCVRPDLNEPTDENTQPDHSIKNTLRPKQFFFLQPTIGH